jgi:hypothetical protein
MPSRPTSQTADPAPISILRLKLRLLDVRPMIWRRVLVPASYTLHDLHGVIQVAMGWDSIHLYRFLIDDAYYGSPDLHLKSANIALSQLRLRKGATFLYEYELGDFWQHEIRLEDVRGAKPGLHYPVCPGGAHAGPPEDCGGAPGYEQGRQEAAGLDAFEDYDTMVEAVEEAVLNGNRDFLNDEDRRWRLEQALERVEARQPFLSDEFSMPTINDRFRRDEHHVLMHQQY